jgi:hypothetical protein
MLYYLSQDRRYKCLRSPARLNGSHPPSSPAKRGRLGALVSSWLSGNLRLDAPTSAHGGRRLVLVTPFPQHLPSTTTHRETYSSVTLFDICICICICVYIYFGTIHRTMLRSNSEYSLQDLSNRAGPRLRPSQTREHSDTDRNSNGEGSAVPQPGNDSTSGESERKSKTRLGRFWRDYVSCEVDLSASRDHLGMCTEAHGEGSARVRLEEEFCVARG